MANDTPKSAPGAARAEETTPPKALVDLPARDAEGADPADVRGGGGGFLVAQAPTSQAEADQITINLEKATAARAASWDAVLGVYR